jgi:predicted MPP superfamily phosphohydrolase
VTHLPHDGRTLWRQNRLALEERLRDTARRTTMTGERRAPVLLGRVLGPLVGGALRLVGLHGRAQRNALDLRFPVVEIRFPRLPPAFDGYRILHLSDLHVGDVPTMTGVLAAAVAGLAVDLAVITGDFQSHAQPPAVEAGRLLAPLLSALAPADGVLAVLGNHDEAALAEVLESQRVRVLVNESTTITRRGEHLHVAGTDDVHAFYTAAAGQALAACRDGFRIALVHTVDLVEPAERLGYALYLSGHTHGGQIALPGGRPLMTALDRHRHLARGVWRHGRLQGYTSAGTGSGDPPLRLNTRPEAALITLRRG